MCHLYLQKFHFLSFDVTGWFEKRIKLVALFNLPTTYKSSDKDERGKWIFHLDTSAPRSKRNLNLLPAPGKNADKNIRPMPHAFSHQKLTLI